LLSFTLTLGAGGGHGAAKPPLPSEQAFGAFVLAQHPVLEERLRRYREDPTTFLDEQYQEQLASHRAGIPHALSMCEYLVGRDRADCEERARRPPDRASSPLPFGAYLDPLDSYPRSWDYEPREADPESLFLRHRIFWGSSSRLPLRRVSLPSGDSFSLFSFDGTTIREHVPDAPEVTEAVLRAEGPRIFVGSTPALVRFLAAALAWPQHATRPVVIAAAAEILEYERSTGGGGYRVDREELARYEPKLMRPLVEGDSTSGWTVAFVALRRQTLELWRLHFGADFALAISTETLSTKVFSQVPAILH
jgi:hypothetical protein